MSENDSNLVECLDVLLSSCAEGERHCRRCAAQADALRLQWLLTQRAQVLHKNAAEWRVLRAQHIGAALPPDDPVRSAGELPGCNDAQLLGECERFEDGLLQRLRGVLDEDLPIVIRAVAQRHCDGTRRQRAQLRALRFDMLAAIAPQTQPQPQRPPVPFFLRPLDLEAA